MSIEEQLNEMRQNVANSYVKVKSKGGTLPQDRNLANLPDAIDSISGGGGGGGANLGQLYATWNTTYNAIDYGYDGFDQVQVDVTPQYPYVDVSGTDAEPAHVLYGFNFASETAGGISTGNMQVYSGSYNITPSTTQQTLQTQKKYLSSNIVIDAVQPSTFVKTAKPNTWQDPTSWTTILNWSIYPKGRDVWTDGENYYYNENSASYVYDKATNDWVSKTWTGLTDFLGEDVWTYNGRIFYSGDTLNDQYELDIATSTWTQVTFTGLTSVYYNGYYKWTDGTNMYHTYSNTTHKFDATTNSWTEVTWATGSSNPTSGGNIVSLGTDIYHLNGYMTFVYNKNSRIWTRRSMSSTYGQGNNLWTDGVNFYISRTNQGTYKMDFSTMTGTQYTFTGGLGSNFDGRDVYCMYGDIYLSTTTLGLAYKLNKKILSARTTV